MFQKRSNRGIETVGEGLVCLQTKVCPEKAKPRIYSSEWNLGGGLSMGRTLSG
jgi:hypothetical protein